MPVNVNCIHVDSFGFCKKKSRWLFFGLFEQREACVLFPGTGVDSCDIQQKHKNPVISFSGEVTQKLPLIDVREMGVNSNEKN